MKEFNNKRILHVSHTDLDGYGCQFVVKKYIEQNNIECEYDGVNVDYYEDIVEILGGFQKKYDIVVVTDLNLKSDDLCNISQMFNDVIYIDHHLRNDDIVFDGKTRSKNNIKYLGSYDYSATYLTYIYFFEKQNNDIFELVKLIDVYDLWRLERKNEFILSCSLSDTVYYLNDVYRIFDKQERFDKIYSIMNEIYSYYINYDKDKIDSVLENVFGGPLIEKMKKIHENLELFGKELVGFPIAVNLINSLNMVEQIEPDFVIEDYVFVMKNKKDILQYGYMKLIEKFNIPIIINVSELKDNNLSISVRSFNGEAINCAEYFGGGGHANAGGAFIKNMTFDEFVGKLSDFCLKNK